MTVQMTCSRSTALKLAVLCAVFVISCSSGTEGETSKSPARDSGAQDSADADVPHDAQTELDGARSDGGATDWLMTLAAFCNQECQSTQGLSCATQYATLEACSVECRREWQRLWLVRCDTEVPAYVYCVDDHPGAQSYTCPGGVKTAADDACNAAFAAVKHCAEN